MTNTLWHSCEFSKGTLLIARLKPGFGSLDIHPSQLDARQVGDGDAILDSMLERTFKSNVIGGPM